MVSLRPRTSEQPCSTFIPPEEKLGFGFRVPHFHAEWVWLGCDWLCCSAATSRSRRQEGWKDNNGLCCVKSSFFMSLWREICPLCKVTLMLCSIFFRLTYCVNLNVVDGLLLSPLNIWYILYLNFCYLLKNVKSNLLVLFIFTQTFLRQHTHIWTNLQRLTITQHHHLAHVNVGKNLLCPPLKLHVLCHEILAWADHSILALNNMWHCSQSWLGKCFI